jgi:hypothetical protein
MEICFLSSVITLTKKKWHMNNNKDLIAVFGFTRKGVYQGFESEFSVKMYKIIILPTVLYGCRTWSLTLQEEHRLKVLENRLLKRIHGPKRENL